MAPARSKCLSLPARAGALAVLAFLTACASRAPQERTLVDQDHPTSAPAKVKTQQPPGQATAAAATQDARNQATVATREEVAQRMATRSAEVHARMAEAERGRKDELASPAVAPAPAMAMMEMKMSGAAAAPYGALALQAPAEFDTERYAHRDDNRFLRVSDEPLSTFSIDVDTASYSNVRRFLNSGTLPPAGAVRVEELVNYFRYDYELPKGDDPFAATAEVSGCPWSPDHRLVRIGLKGREIPQRDLPPVNLVFLLDVSGSMMSPDKLPLVKDGMRMLVQQLGSDDRVGITVYAGAAGVVLEPTSGADKGRILEAIDELQAGGSTNGAEGIRLAYQLAEQSFAKGGVNRVILATDGDFNVGTTSESELVKLIEEERGKGVFLTVLGFGRGNLNDSTMEMLADKGNGNYAYIDTIDEARKVLVSEAGATLVAIAKDVKVQVEFNPAEVEAYRLVGYENRLLANQDFNDDTKDAGEIGAGHVVTAFYEVVPKGGRVPGAGVDPLKYQQPTRLTGASDSGELATIKLRYKQPDGDTSRLLSFPVSDDGATLRDASEDFRFAAAVASFGLLLRGGDAGAATWTQVLDLARATTKGEPLREEFVGLAERAATLSPHAVAVR